MLYALLAAPLMAALATCFASDKDGESSFRLSFFLALLCAGLSLPLVTCMPVLDGSFGWFTLWGTKATVHLHLASDGLSGWLIQLATWLTPVALLGSRSLVGSRMREFAVCVFIMEAFMIGALLSRDLVVFYLFFEAMLIPMVVLIALFGGAERRSAALWFFLYTMLGSILMLVSIWYLAWQFSTTEVSELIPQLANWPGGDRPFYLIDLPSQFGHLQWFQVTTKGLLFFSFALAFAVKVPLAPLHSWQARVYAEAPAGAAVLLAGVMAKIGIYGFLRFVLPLFPEQSALHAPLFITLGVISVLGGALIALVQDDVKRLIAFSSLSHLGLVMVGIFTFHPAALAGVPVQMVAHGLSVAALFLIVGYLEGRTACRGIDDFGGLAGRMPIFAVLFIIAALASAALPGTGNFAGEFLLLFGTFAGAGLTVTILVGLTVIIGVIYLLTWVQRWLFGVRHASLDSLSDLGAGEVMAILPLLIITFVLGFYPTAISRSTSPVLEGLCAPARVASQQNAVNNAAAAQVLAPADADHH